MTSHPVALWYNYTDSESKLDMELNEIQRPINICGGP
jgi:hypothetical protein